MGKNPPIVKRIFTMSALCSRFADGLHGTISVAGDKSISHRALIFGAMAVGKTTITGLLEGEDVLCTAEALRHLGATITKEGTLWIVDGVGVGGLTEPTTVLDVGNSGTSARLLMGLVASYPFTTFFTGDASLRKRPMQRAMTPLQQMGVAFTARSGGRLPLAVNGTADTLPITYTLPVPSAQVKSAVLLAGLNTAGITKVIEPIPSRDHTERMLEAFGASIVISQNEQNERVIALEGQPELNPQNIVVPRDPSSAAFPLVAALITKNSDVTLPNICLNPHRIGLITTLQEMGARLTLLNKRIEGSEDVADIRVESSALKGVDVPASRAPSMIDEYPILAVAASCAVGTTIMRGLGELKVKESDRLAGIATGLAACGVTVEVADDTLIVHGKGQPQGGATIAVNLDHRMAMSFLVLGMASKTPITVDDGSAINTSFPNFVNIMNAAGANIR
jgi:3-phosphoshikimate 1-carboxyvinyltransferase